MLDIKFLRNNPDVVKENIKKKFQFHKVELVDKAIELDKQIRAYKQEGFNFAWTLRSGKDPKVTYYEKVYTPKEYNK